MGIRDSVKSERERTLQWSSPRGLKERRECFNKFPSQYLHSFIT